MDAIEAEKATAIRRYRRLQHIGTLLRCLEAVAVLLLLSWSSVRLPAAARISADFLRRLAAVLLSPRFVFLLGNAIVLLLFAKSGQLSSTPSSASAAPASSAAAAAAAAGDIYEEFLESRGARMPCSSLAPPPHEEVVYEDKEVCVETRVYRRSRSERMERRPAVRPELRRAETDLAGRKGGEFSPAEKEAEEERPLTESVDAEEFRRAVEAFIAKQANFHREESIATFTSAIVCSAGLTEQGDIH